ncbi:MAG: hypothetical protein QOI31_2547 [Solirubrobacterales bacterium]|jgi:hypothetical protein|nr:hypothetical protein [Solirubrobacterales bacterium]
MVRRDRGTPEAARSPLVELEAELRAIDYKRREAIRIAERKAGGRFEALQRVAPGSWSELETTVYIEQAA